MLNWLNIYVHTAGAFMYMIQTFYDQTCGQDCPQMTMIMTIMTHNKQFMIAFAVCKWAKNLKVNEWAIII